MHTTNEQMSKVMGWTTVLSNGKEYAGWFGWKDVMGSIPVEAWKPTADLNHAALVEQRIRELGLEQQYLEAVLFHEGNPTNMTEAFKRLLFASAQTRCDAAWQVWQQWKKEQTT